VASEDGSEISRQHGVCRTNCLDSLDRTNKVQTKLAWWNLPGQLQAIGLAVPNSFEMNEWVEPNDSNLEEDGVMGTGQESDEHHVDKEDEKCAEQAAQDGGDSAGDEHDVPVGSDDLDGKIQTVEDDSLSDALEAGFRRLWRANGDHISTQYAGSAALRKDTHTNEAFADLDSGLRFGKQLAINMQYNARRYMMNTVADPIKNDILAVILGYPKAEAGSSSALWVAEQMRARRDEYTRTVRTQAVICTYNVGLATPSKQMVQGLRPLLRPHGVVDGTTATQQPEDAAGGIQGGPAFVLVGLQRVARTTSVGVEIVARWSELVTAEVEVVYGNRNSSVGGSGAKSPEIVVSAESPSPGAAPTVGLDPETSEDAPSKQAPTKTPRAYVLLLSKAAGGSLLLVFLRRDLATTENPDVAVQNARVAWYSSGMLSGSRGTLAFRCECSGSSLCFMSSHFEGKTGEISDTLKCDISQL
jgi:hypothetical protein